MFGPPIGTVGTQWELQSDLSEQLHTFLRDNNWLVRGKAQSCTNCLAITRMTDTRCPPSAPLGLCESYRGSRRALAIAGG